MTKRRSLIVPAVLLGIVLVVVGALYLALPAHSLPGFFPGHAGKGSADYNHHHAKHAIAAFVVGIGCFVFAWFQSGPAGGPAARAPAG